MYATLLYMHSWLRWIVLIAGLIAVVRAASALAAKQGWSDDERKFQLGFVIALDLQFVLGLLLWFTSPFAQVNMKDRMLRFFSVEHGFMAVVALALLHILSAKSKKAADPARRMKLWAYGAIAGFVLILVAIPWPMFSYGRPLFRLP